MSIGLQKFVKWELLLLIFSILQGGVSTGLTHVEMAKSPKLYIVKGKRQPIIRQLPTISWDEFNEGDVFVLETMTQIFVWVGRDANRLEKLQAAKVKFNRYIVLFKIRY